MMRQIFTVSQITAYIHRIFDADYALGHIFLKGEVSNCKYHSSGHIYFTLKDERSSIRCVMFSSDKKGLSFPMENGQQVVVRGHISVFERDGTYQLYAKEIELSGAGVLHQRYEQLKKELNEKGYFDFDRKKELPPYPSVIGIVTALTGAAIEDIKSVAARRNPYIQLFLYPAKVQGEGAAESIAEGIRFFDRQGVDIIIIGRGGGSMEDLWAFNEREVADAIYAAKTPIISGTGHEIDMTIADYCADVRAATPSAACELAIPDVCSLIQQLDMERERLTRLLLKKVGDCRREISACGRVLEASHPGTRLKEQRMICRDLSRRLTPLMRERLTEKRHAVQLRGERLHALSPTARLTGGYVFAQDEEERPIISAGQIKEQRPFELVFSEETATITPWQVKRTKRQD